MTDKDITGVLREAIEVLRLDLALHGGRKSGRSAKLDLIEKLQTALDKVPEFTDENLECLHLYLERTEEEVDEHFGDGQYKLFQYADILTKITQKKNDESVTERSVS